MGGEWNFIHSPPIFRAQSCLTDAVIVIFPDYCFTDTHLNQGGTLFLNGKPLCYVTSQNAYDYFSQDDDGNGLERGALVAKILTSLERNPLKADKGYQDRWDKVWADPICQQYRRAEHEDFWLWNQAFYEAPVEDLQHIAQLVTGGGRKR